MLPPHDIDFKAAYTHQLHIEKRWLGGLVFPNALGVGFWWGGVDVGRRRGCGGGGGGGVGGSSWLGFLICVVTVVRIGILQNNILSLSHRIPQKVIVTAGVVVVNSTKKI